MFHQMDVATDNDHQMELESCLKLSAQGHLNPVQLRAICMLAGVTEQTQQEVEDGNLAGQSLVKTIYIAHEISRKCTSG